MTEPLRTLLLRRESLRAVTRRDLAIVALAVAGLTSAEIARLRSTDVELHGAAGLTVVVRRARRLTRIPLDQWERAAVVRYLEVAGHWGQDVTLLASYRRGPITPGGVRRVLRRARLRAEERSA